jgi:hypothetical protein
LRNDNKNRNNIVADHAGNIRTIISRLRTRGIAVIYSTEGGGPADAAIARSAGASLCGGMYKGVPPEDLESSRAGRHPTPQGHDIIAARMLPCVMRALGRKS